MRTRSLFIAFAASVALAAGAALPEPYSQTPSAKDYPGADILVLSETREFTLASDGKVTEKMRRVEKIFSYQGMDSIGDPKVAFHKTDQTLRDAFLKTYTADGEIKEAKANSFTEITPHPLGLAPDYTGWREMVMSKIGLDLNAVVESGWTIEDLRPWRKYLNLQVELSDGFPALERRVVIRVPAGTVLHASLHRLSPDPTFEHGRREGEFEVYSWTLRNQSALNVAELGGESHFLIPRLSATTCPDWNAANETYAGFAKEAILASSPTLAAKAKKLVEGKTTQLQKADAITSFVASSIRTVRWPLDTFDYRPRPASRVYDSGYGHSLDKAVLLCAMLEQVGIHAAPALCAMAPTPADDPEPTPSVAQFDTVIVHAKLGEETLWLSPEAPLSERSHANFQGYAGLPLVPGLGEIHRMTPVGPDNIFALDGEAELDGDFGYKGKATLHLAGVYCPFYQVQGSTDGLKDHLSALLKSLLPGAKLTVHDVSKLSPKELEISFQFEFEGEKGVALSSLKTGLPDASALAHVPGIHRNSRDFALLLPPAGRESVRLSFKLPAGRKPSYLPPSIEKACDGATCLQTWAVVEGRLQWNWSADLPMRLISPSDYSVFRRIVTTLQSDASRIVLF